MFTQTIIIGNLGKDPEMRYTPTQKAVTSFSVATTKTLAGGEKKTTWYRVSCWEKNAENANKYLTKGSKVMCIGEIEEPKIFTGQDGTPRTGLEMTAHQIKFLSSKEGDAPAMEASPVASQSGDDIPF